MWKKESVIQWEYMDMSVLACELHPSGSNVLEVIGLYPELRYTCINQLGK